MKRLICAKEVEACAQQGHKVMYIDADTLITPSGCARMRSGGSRRNRQRADLQGAQDADG